MSDRRRRGSAGGGAPGDTPWVPIAAGVLLGVGVLAVLYKYLSAKPPAREPDAKKKCNKDPVLLRAKLRYPDADSCVMLPEECEFLRILDSHQDDFQANRKK